VSEHTPEQAGKDAGAVDTPAVPPAADGAADLQMASQPGIDAPSIAPDREALPTPDMPTPDMPTLDMPTLDMPTLDMPRLDMPRLDMPRFDMPRFDMPKFDMPKPDMSKPDMSKPDMPKADASKPEVPEVQLPRIDVPKLATRPDAEPTAEPKAEFKAEFRAGSEPGRLIAMAPTERARDREEFAPHVKAEQKDTGSKRRLSAMAAVVALAACVGAISGALATAGVMHLAATGAPAPVKDNGALEASVARIDADMVALKASLDHTSRTGVTQFNRTSDRLDKLEKAQAEPASRLAKLSEAVDKLRAAQTAVPAQTAAAKDTTGAIASAHAAAAPPAAAAPAQAAAAPPKAEVGRLPTVEGWRLRDVVNGGALIENRSGLYEVYAGDPVPGLGRIDAIRRQDGRWVVVTSKGLIVSR
jgi:hypothetical protein